MRALIGMLILTVFMLDPGHTQPDTESARHQDSPSFLEHIQQGKALYEGLARCIHCHGQTAVRRPLSKEELFAIIKNGVPGTSHMPFKHLLSDEEIWAIVQYQLHDTCMNGCEN